MTPVSNLDYPGRHSPLMTPKGRARFDAPGDKGEYFVYHTRRDFTKIEWQDQFGEKAGKLLFRMYPADRCVCLDAKTGLPLVEVTSVEEPGTVKSTPIEESKIPGVEVGEIWLSKKKGDEYEVIEITSSGITIAWVEGKSYRRTKPTLEALEKFYKKKE